MNLYFSSGLSLNFSVPVLMLTVHLLTRAGWRERLSYRPLGHPSVRGAVQPQAPRRAFAQAFRLPVVRVSTTETTSIPSSPPSTGGTTWTCAVVHFSL